MKNEECVFCVFSKDEKIKVWEDKLFYAMYDSYPVSPGHTLVIPKRHVVNFDELTFEEWQSLNAVIKSVKKMNENKDFRKIYSQMLYDSKSDISKWFLTKAVENKETNKKPQAYNYGVNDGLAAGRTVNHFHWHIIPRYDGDMEDPRGGVRYVIPDLGNYKVSRS